jgi:hypothetical protein
MVAGWVLSGTVADDVNPDWPPPAYDSSADVWLLRLRSLVAKAHRGEAAYRDCGDRYRVSGEGPGPMCEVGACLL